MLCHWNDRSLNTATRRRSCHSADPVGPFHGGDAGEAMSCYPSSTQRRHWTLSADEIARRRSEARARAIDAANEARAARVGGAPSEEAPTIDPPTPDEEALLRRYYEVKIQKVCQAFSLPTKVRATAVALFKRFLTRTSPLDRSHSLKVTMLTSIYVACKVEENYVSAEEIGKGMQEDHNKVLAAELSILASLEFQLVTYSPYRAVDALAREMIEPKPSDGLAPRAHAVCDAIMLTDAPLTFPPGVLALAALRAAAAESAPDEAAVNALLNRLRSGPDGFVSDGFGPTGDKAVEGTSKTAGASRRDGRTSLSAELDEVAAALGGARGGEDEDDVTIATLQSLLAATQPDEDAVRRVDKKLRAWHRALAASGRAGGGDEKSAPGDGDRDGYAREGKRRKSAADERRRKEEAEDAALDGP